MRILAVTLAVAMNCLPVCARGAAEQSLAHELAGDGTRENAVAKIVARGSSVVPLLLSWTRKPPADVNEHDLNVGLADAFGRLKTKEAIPFLIKNISMKRGALDDTPNTWLKVPEVIERRLPAVVALIQIGPEASEAVMRASWQRPMVDDAMLAAIFVVSRIPNVPGARRFLSSALSGANLQMFWAQEGIDFLDRSQPSGPAPGR